MNLRSKFLRNGILSTLLLLILSGLTYMNEYSFEETNQENNYSAIINPEKISLHTGSYNRADGTKIKIITYTSKANKKYLLRYINAVKVSLEFFENYLTEYPYDSILIVDAADTPLEYSALQEPSVITIRAEMFSPLETQQPEYLIVHTFTEQLLYGKMKKERKLFDEGLITYIAGKIMYKYYGDPVITFDLFEYYPVPGLNFLSYNEIPLIYTLGKYYYREGAISYKNYIKAPHMFTVTDSLNIFSDPGLKEELKSKPHLTLIALERYIGFYKMMSIIRHFISADKQVNAGEFISLANNNMNEDITWFLNNLFYGSSVFDYKIKYVKRSQDNISYNVYLERLGDGIFKQDVVLYTNKDTLYQKWNGSERRKVITFKTTNEVIGAEIDPYQKNILDLDYSNNSYFIRHQYGGSISLSLRWFFWMQNLLLILGSIA